MPNSTRPPLISSTWATEIASGPGNLTRAAVEMAMQQYDKAEADLRREEADYVAVDYLSLPANVAVGRSD